MEIDPLKNATELAKSKTVKKIYEDVFQPVAKETGKALGTVGEFVNLALGPVRGLIWGGEEIYKFISKRIEEKFSDLSKEELEERFVVPDPHVVGPAMEALRFTKLHPTLQELFASLIATSIDREVASQAHPSFVEIIKQFSTDDAKILKLTYQKGPQPLISIFKYPKENTFPNFRPDVTPTVVCEKMHFIGRDAECLNPELVNLSIDNLIRLGLCEIPNNRFVNEPKFYKELEESKKAKEFIKKINEEGTHQPSIEKHTLFITELGRHFCLACKVDEITLGENSNK